MGSMPGHLFLASILFGQNRHGDSPSSSFQPLSNLLSSHYLRDHSVAHRLLLGLANTVFCGYHLIISHEFSDSLELSH